MKNGNTDEWKIENWIKDNDQAAVEKIVWFLLSIIIESLVRNIKGNFSSSSTKQNTFNWTVNFIINIKCNQMQLWINHIEAMHIHMISAAHFTHVVGVATNKITKKNETKKSHRKW